MLALLLTVVMVIAMLPMTALAAQNGTALPDAVNGVITLDEDVDISETGYTVSGDIILDLAGHNLKVANSETGSITVPAGASLTLRDTATNSTGKIYTETNYGGAYTTGVIRVVGGTFIMESGRIEALCENPADNGQFAIVLGSGGKVTIKGGEIEAGWYAISGNGTDIALQSEINIEGGTLVSTTDYALYLPHNCIIKISSGIVTGAAGGIAQRNGTLEISGGTIASQGTGNTGDWSDGTSGMGNAAVNVGDNNRGLYGNVSVTISGGNFTAAGNAVSVNIGTSTDKYTADVSVTGGMFADDVSAYTGDDYICTENSDGTYTVAPLGAANAVAEVNGTYYKTLADAFDRTAGDSTITMLKDATVSETIISGKNLTLDLNGHTITGAFGEYGRRVFHVDNGVLNLTGSGTVTTKAQNDSVFVPNSSVIRVGNGNTWSNAGQNTAGLVIGKDVTVLAPASYGVGAFGSDTTETLTVYGKVISTSDASAVAGNGMDTLTGTVITIADGAVISATDAVAIYHPQAGTMTIGAASITGTGGIEAKAGATTIAVEGAYVTATGELSHEANSDGTSSDGYAIAAVENDDYAGDATITISSGYYTGPVAVLTDSEVSEEQKAAISISGGYFNSDPSAYVADGKAALTSDKDGYAFMVDTAPVTDVEPAVGAPSVTVGSEINENDVDTVKAAAESVEAGAELAAAANGAVANVSDADKAEATDVYEKEFGDTQETVNIYAQTYLAITPTAYDSNEKIMTLDITPMYRVVATTEDDPQNIVVKGEATGSETPNAVALEGSEKELNIKTMTLSIKLPSGFVSTTDPIFVQHKGYEYTATVKQDNSDYIATFTNPHGFSEFTFTTSPTAEAQLNGIGYDSLTDAMAAAQNGDEVTVLKDGLTATMSGSSRKITLKNGTSAPLDVTINGKAYTISASGTEEITYTAPSGSSGYAVNVDKTSNGKVTVSPSRASKNATVTITVTPDKGYVLDTLTVTDANDKEVSLTKVSDTKYTFKMPASKVTVKATFVDEGLPFTDVSGHWALDAIEYVYDNGMMDGVSDTRFAPDNELTRGMIVTILWRLENKPQVNYLMTFSDVASEQWYTEAVRWAAAEGIVTGYPDGTFGPETSITREQLAAILYRYAQYKDYDVSVGEDTNILSYPDVADVSEYAISAFQWACGSGVITGMANSTLVPQGTATRAQVATMLMRFCETVAK